MYFHRTQLASSAIREYTIKLWDTNTWTEVATLTGHPNWVRSVTFSPDGHWLASAGDDGIVNLWNTDNLQEIVSFDHADWGYSVAFSPDGRLLASSGGSEGVIKIWDVIGKRHIITLAGSPFSDRLGTFSPDGQLLASSGGSGGIKLWDTNNWQEVATLSEQTDLVWSIAFSPDGRLFVSSGGSGGIKLWNTNNWQEVTSLTGHTDWVWSVAFSPDGHRLASGGSDGVILLWDVTPYIDINPDINDDGIVSIFDLVLVAKHFGSQSGSPNYNSSADLNSDGVIDVSDLLLVGQSLGVGAAPPTYTSDNLSVLTNLYAMIEEIPYLDGGTELARSLLKRLIQKYSPRQTKLLHNYPNPFNPETWIPYQLASDSKVSITIYDVSGRQIRVLDLGVQPRGSYVTKDKAAYWDGKNDVGESVSSGIYIYQMSAGAYRASKKMVIHK